MPVRERVALDHAMKKLEVMGDKLPFPHQSAVRDSVGIRELRPRGGRSAHRGLYARRGETHLLLAVGPEAESDRQGFQRAVRMAEERLAGLGEGR